MSKRSKRKRAPANSPAESPAKPAKPPTQPLAQPTVQPTVQPTDRPAPVVSDATEPTSPRWTQSTKQIVGVAALLVLTIVLWRFRTLLTSIVIASLVAYLLAPPIEMVWQRTPLNRVLSVLVVYTITGIVAALVGWTLLISGLEQLIALATELPQQIFAWASAQIEAYATVTDGGVLRLLFDPENPREINLNTLLGPEQNDMLRDVLNPSLIFQRASAAFLSTGSLALRLVLGATGVLTNSLLILFLSIYLAKDASRFRRTLTRAAHSANYGSDAEQLLTRFKHIWDAYLRGQLILALVIFLIVGTALSLLGVDNAWGLAVVAGVAEFLPIIGPTVSTGVAVLTALIQPLDAAGAPTNALGLGPIGLALAVFILMFVIQQIEQAVLVPRIVGNALDLHPILVLTGVVMGTSIAGVLGAILAAPVLASVKLVSRYLWNKMLDQAPFPDKEMPVGGGLSLPGWGWLRRQFAQATARRAVSGN